MHHAKPACLPGRELCPRSGEHSRVLLRGLVSLLCPSSVPATPRCPPALHQPLAGATTLTAQPSSPASAQHGFLLLSSNCSLGTTMEILFLNIVRNDATVSSCFSPSILHILQTLVYFTSLLSPPYAASPTVLYNSDGIEHDTASPCLTADNPLSPCHIPHNAPWS